MSASVNDAVKYGVDDTAERKPAPKGGASNYKGFVAGIFSGIAKLSG